MAAARILIWLWTATAMAFALVATLAPLHHHARVLLDGLGLDPRPHRPELHAMLVTRFAGNVRIALLPVLLAAIGAARHPATRAAGDLAVTGTLVANAGLVGAALAVDGRRLLLYLPHLPLEWAALACCAAPWLLARHQRLPARTLVALCAAGLLLLALAALAETYLTPTTRR